MPGPVPAQANMLTQLIMYLRADGPLAGFVAPTHVLPDPTGQIVPGAGIVPFLWIRELSDAVEAEQGNLLVSFVIEAHDLPDNGRYTIRKAIERCEWILHDVVWERPTDSMRVPIRSYWRSVLGPMTDEGWNTQKYLGTFVVRSN